MQDVIFSGTQLRKPVGSAYVAITLDNSDHALSIDFDEVTVARRIYRSGESEYLINGTVCRLKDVNELFYDTGIGKEGYSIIGQGQIDKILSSKPEDRRELFDEAAGIVKYKRRKVEALKKLENERANLLRVTDILSELDRQIGALEKQSQKAKIYLTKKEELKKYDINVFLLDSAVIDKKIEELQTTSDDLQGMQLNVRSFQETLGEISTRYDRLEKKQEQIDAISNQVDQTFDVLKALESRLNDASRQVNNLPDQISDVQKNIDTLVSNRSKISDAVQQLSSLQSILDETESRVEKIQNSREGIGRTETRLVNLDSEIDKKLNLLAAITRDDIKKNPAPQSDRLTPQEKDNIITLKRQGWSIEEIARRMKRSEGEVEMVIEMGEQ